MVDLSQTAVDLDERPPQLTVTDALLVARAQQDPAAFAPLYEAYFDAVYRYCFHRLGDWEAAEDTTSLVFTNALTALPRFRVSERSGSFRSWLFAIAHNVVVNQHRARGKYPVRVLADAGEVPDAAPSPEEEALAAEARQTVRDVLTCLTDEQRHVLELRLAGLTDTEIASVLGRKHGAIRAVQYRAAIRLRELLGAEREEASHA